MTFVAFYGNPDLLITFTSNPSWSQINENLFPQQSSKNRHDIVARVFKQKLTNLLALITKTHIFDETSCHMYSVEWQKRCLHLAHILIWLKENIQHIWMIQ